MGSRKMSMTDRAVKLTEKCKTRESLVKAMKKAYPDINRKLISNCIYDLLKQNRLPSAYGSGIVGCSAKAKNGGSKVPKKFKNAVSIDAIKDEWDDKAKIEEGLLNLEGNAIKDNDFRVELGIAHSRWKSVSESEDFSKYKIELKGKQFRGTYWGQEEIIKDLQRAVDII